MSTYGDAASPARERSLSAESPRPGHPEPRGEGRGVPHHDLRSAEGQVVWQPHVGGPTVTRDPRTAAKRPNARAMPANIQKFHAVGT